jgi:branched-chain amino acid transport system permease protein
VTTAVEAVILGVLAGAVYALFSVGLSVSFGVLRLVNFAHGDFVMLGMYFGYFAAHSWGLPIGAVIVSSVVPAALLGYVVYQVFFRGTGQGGNHDQLLIAIGLSILLENGTLEIFGESARSVNVLSVQTFHLGPIYLPEPQLLAAAVAVILVAAFDLGLRKTSFGRAVRAVVADRTVAELNGIRPNLVFLGTFMASIVSAAIAGIVLLGYLPVTPEVGGNLILIGFISVVLGGAGDVRGTAAAAVIVGLTESLVTTYWAARVQDVVAYALFILVAILRPRGLFNRGAVEAGR